MFIGIDDATCGARCQDGDEYERQHVPGECLAVEMAKLKYPRGEKFTHHA